MDSKAGGETRSWSAWAEAVTASAAAEPWSPAGHSDRVLAVMRKYQSRIRLQPQE
jgi:hypothetical protein